MLDFNFSNYLMVIEGISYNYFDSNYDGRQADEIIDGYNNYNINNWEKDVETFFDDNYDDDYNMSYVKRY
jgi:hypothetical protein